MFLQICVNGKARCDRPIQLLACYDDGMNELSIWISTLGVIFAVIDPFGYVPIFLAMTAKDTPKKRNAMLRKACITAFLVLAIFTIFGKFILRFFGISIPAMQISGGLILLVIGFDMLQVLPVKAKLAPDEETEGSRKDDISIVPLAIPMLSGPATMTSVAVLTSKSPGAEGVFAILVSVLVTLAFTYLILQSANRILKYFGLTGLHVATRIMGLLLCAMAIQFVIDGYLAVR